MNYYIPFTIFVLGLIFSLIYPLVGKKSKKKSAICIATGLGSIMLLAFMSLVVHPELESNARYSPDGEVDIIWNQADSEYYINYLGRPIKLRDACPEQFGNYIPRDKIKNIPTVNVYEKTYMSSWGFTLSNNPQVHFVHGTDARIDQNIEIE